LTFHKVTTSSLARPHILPIYHLCHCTWKCRPYRALHLECGEERHLPSLSWDFLSALSFLLAIGTVSWGHMWSCTVSIPSLAPHMCYALYHMCVMFLQRAAHRNVWGMWVSLPSSPIRKSELCSCCRLLGYSRPGTVPEHARLLLPQGPCLHHGTRPAGR
jgi:hypothetical protein